MVGEALGRYRVLEKIGSGGMGEVYRAHDNQLDRDVALKILPSGALADEAARKLFRKEALTLAKLNHPCIATVHEFSSQDGVDFLVMELISGMSIKAMLKDGPVPEDQLRRLGLQLAEGLNSAHVQGIVHCDLKPANLMVISDGRLKILDFGLAKLLETSTYDHMLTPTPGDALPGTLPYMSPEQLRGNPVDVRTDVYATGAVLYEMCTGRPPLPETNAARLIESILHQTPRPPCELNRHVSPNLQRILLKALEKNPDDRYRSINEIRVELERLEVTVTKPETTITLELSQRPLEIAHVLFVDLVQYSVLPMEEQRRRLRDLHKIARTTGEFARANSVDQLISLPSGDGMALVFFEDPEAPVRCAVEVSLAIRAMPEIKVRMGVHSGPVYRVPDINDENAVAGGGINFAQRVMDCGDAGHILLSNAAADVLTQLSHWSSSLHDLGEVDVKHGVQLHIFNFYTHEVGNPALPTKMKQRKPFRKQGVHPSSRRAAPRAGSGSSRRGTKIPQRVIADETFVNNVFRHLSAAIKQRGWRRIAAIVLVSTIAVVAAQLSRRFLPFPRTTEGRPKHFPVPTDGKYLAVLPFEIQGGSTAVKSIAQSLADELSKKYLMMPGMAGVVSTAASEALAEEGLINISAPYTETAGDLQVNRMIRGTVEGTAQDFRVVVTADDAQAGRSFSKTFSGGQDTIKVLANQVYTWTLQAVNLVVSLPAPSPVQISLIEDLAKFDSYLRSYAVTDSRQLSVNAQKALQFYEESVRRNPRSALDWVGLARARLAMYSAKGQPSWSQDSLIAAEHAENLGDGELPAQAHRALGEVYRDKGLYPEACKHFRRAILLAPNDELWRVLGQAYEADGKEKEAIIALENAVAMNSTNERNYNALGNAYYGFSRYDMARIAYHRAIEINPDYVNAQMNIGNTYFDQAKYDNAIVEYQKTLRLGPSPAVSGNLGVAYLFVRRYNEAIEILEQAVKLEPNNEERVGNLADAYRAAGSKEKAAQTYRVAITLARNDLEANPNNITALGDLALYCAKTGDYTMAEHYIREARSRDAASPDLLYREAIVRSISNQQSGALESLRSAFEKGTYAEKARLDPDLDSLHDSPSFAKLVKEFLSKQH